MAFGEMTRHDMVILPGQGFLMRIASGRERGERRRVMRNTLTRLVPQTKTTPKSWDHANGVTRGTPGNQNAFKIRISLRLFRANPLLSPRKACLYIF